MCVSNFKKILMILYVIQEAELRRLSEQQANMARNRSRQEKPLPDSVIKSLTQRVQNKAR